MQLNGPWRTLFDTTRGTLLRVKKSKPKSMELNGLVGKVEVHTSDFGVPHIYADNAHDLYFAQGFVTARDRMFQMDYNRLAASGRLCELVGRKTLPWRELTVHLKERTSYDTDVMLRTFGLRRAAEASLALHSKEAQDILAAYAAGVNAYIATGKLSLEHTILRAKPTPWTPADCLLMIRAIGFELNFSWRSVLLGAILQGAHVPEDLQRIIWPHFPVGGPSIVDRDTWAQMAAALAADRQAADHALGFGNAAGVGSNCFAVAGTHTVTGEAMLANDTHLSMVAPVPWYEVRLLGGGFDMHGFALAGLPGVGIGRTPHHAWGITAGLVQDLDLFAEKLKEDDSTQVLTKDGYAPLKPREEVFTIKGEGSHKRTIYESEHGPLLETVATQAPSGQRFAVAWTGQIPGRDFDGLLGMWKATSRDEFTAALANHVCPTFNITYAGADGKIGYVLAGVLPKRKKGTPLRPLEGWTGEWDWQGHVPFAHNPRVLDPKSGFVVTANNPVAPDNYPYEIGNLFEPAERYIRIAERLTELSDKIAFEDLVSLQLDQHSAWGVAARDAMFKVLGGKQGFNRQGRALEQSALEQWAAWDGMAHANSAGAAVGFVTAWSAARALVHRIAGDDAALGFLEMNSFICQPLLELLEQQERLQKLDIDVAAVVVEAFEHAVEVCRTTMGDDTAGWTWGGVHPLICRHRFAGTPLGAFFNIGPEPAGGGPDTVNRGDLDGSNSFRLRVGPAMRFVVSAKSRDVAGTVVPGGQSGDRLSPHYDDQLKLFLRGELKPAPISFDKLGPTRKEAFWPKSS